MRQGLNRPKPDTRDYDFHRTYGTLPVDFPPEYNTDAGLWNPNQNAMALLYGCTGFTQADLCSDEDGTQYDPKDLYENTPPGGMGGRDIRDSLKATVSRGVRKYLTQDAPGNKRTAYFNVRASAPMDFFDSVRLAMYSTQSEKRGVSVGSPYFPEFLSPDDYGRLPTPTNLNISRATWHNYKVCGWKVIGDQPYLMAKPWTGEFVYISRPLFNSLMNISGSCAYTLSKEVPGQVQTIDMGFVGWIVAWVRYTFNI